MDKTVHQCKVEAVALCYAESSKVFADAGIPATPEEVEPYPDTVIVSRGAIVDASVWQHDLPRQAL